MCVCLVFSVCGGVCTAVEWRLRRVEAVRLLRIVGLIFFFVMAFVGLFVLGDGCLCIFFFFIRFLNIFLCVIRKGYICLFFLFRCKKLLKFVLLTINHVKIEVFKDDIYLSIYLSLPF